MAKCIDKAEANQSARLRRDKGGGTLRPTVLSTELLFSFVLTHTVTSYWLVLIKPVLYPIVVQFYFRNDFGSVVHNVNTSKTYIPRFKKIRESNELCRSRSWIMIHKVSLFLEHERNRMKTIQRDYIIRNTHENIDLPITSRTIIDIKLYQDY